MSAAIGLSIRGYRKNYSGLCDLVVRAQSLHSATFHTPSAYPQQTMEDYIKTVELHAQKKAETVVSREDLGLDISSGAAADYPSPVLPKRTLVVPVDGSPDSFAALELGLQMSLDPTPPGVSQMPAVGGSCRVGERVC